MLDLSSPRWSSIRASPGGDGVLTARLLRQLQDGDESAWPELYQQVCHQNTVGEVAYVAVPHLVAIGRTAKPHLRAMLLSTVGSIVASRKCYARSAAQLREEWRAEFDRACGEARILAADALREGTADADDALQIIATLAELYGHPNACLLLA